MLYKRGLAIGTFDLFHIGHLHFLQSASRLCNQLVVAIDSDERVFEHKGHYPVISAPDRLRIVEGLKCVTNVKINETNDNVEEWANEGIDVIFIGANWMHDKDWQEKSERLKHKGIAVHYIIPYAGISTTQIVNKIRTS